MNYKNFLQPPKGYGEVAFFWWHGDVITKEKLLWILDQLEDHHMSGLQINYCHSDSGLTMESDPSPFTEEWWGLVVWFQKEAQKRGMSISLSDYTLSAPGQQSYTDEVLKKHPELTGQMLMLEDDAHPLNPVFYDTELLGTIPAGKVWRVHKPYSLNPMAVGSGEAITDEFFGAFERHMPGEGGKGLNFFFSDELAFNVRGNLWCDDFAEVFLQRKGYDIRTKLEDLFSDTGDAAVKTKLDYYDVIVQLSEERFFQVVYNWHEQRGMIFGCDHGGRGYDVTEFGDYFRTLRWYQGPGNDQANLSSSITRSKVSSSVAHMYERPRVWLEGFHSSGWQTSSADLADAIFRSFALGHNLLSLHGLYYSTHGSYWEWAPPCNHNHMPYWQEMKTLLGGTERLSWLMSQGKHCCDVAVVYPVAAMEADPVLGREAVDCAFSSAEFLYSHGVDFDYIDFQSIERSRIEDGYLKVAGEAYRTVIIPNMRAVRFDMLAKLAAFAEQGGKTIIIGESPIYSDRISGRDPLLDKHVADILAKHEKIQRIEEYYDEYFQCETPDILFPETVENPYFLHRRIDGEDLYYLYHVPAGTECGFRTTGKPILLDPFTGKRYAITAYHSDGVYTYLPMIDRFAGLMLVLFVKDMKEDDIPVFEEQSGITIDFTGEWACELVPTMDNTYGDYRLPVTEEKTIGAEARDFAYRFEGDASWSQAVYSYAPYLYLCNTPIPEEELQTLEKPDDRFVPYSFSMRYGIPGDAGSQSSYHGLKGKVSDDFLGLGKKRVTHCGSSSVYEGDGPYYIMGFVRLTERQKVYLQSGELKPDRIRIDHKLVESDSLVLEAGLHQILLEYSVSGRTHFILMKTDKSDFVQNMPLAMQWYENPDVIPFVPQPWHEGKACEFRFTAPPGTEAVMMPDVFSTVRDTEGSVWHRSGNTYDSDVVHQRSRTLIAEVPGSSAELGPALIQDPIRFICGQGIMNVDLPIEEQGLKHYSGGIRYCKSISLTDASGTVCLRFPALDCAAVVFVNGIEAGVLFAPPYMLDISEQIKPGENRLEIIVHNTLRNHMRTIPTQFLRR